MKSFENDRLQGLSDDWESDSKDDVEESVKDFSFVLRFDVRTTSKEAAENIGRCFLSALRDEQWIGKWQGELILDDSVNEG